MITPVVLSAVWAFAPILLDESAKICKRKAYCCTGHLTLPPIICVCKLQTQTYTRRQTERQTERQTDRLTDGRKD